MRILVSGRVLVGTPEELVDQLRGTMLTPPPTAEKYMRGVARRALVFGDAVLYDDERSFLGALDRLGYIRVLEEH